MRVLRASTAFGLLAVGCNAQNSSASGCDTGLRIIVARGSTEAPGSGRIGVVARNVSLAIPGSTIDPVDYPATFENYTTSEPSGVAAITKMIADYSAKCPSGKIALLGYSQGGQAVMDTLCGESEYGFNDTQPLATSYKSNVIAAVTFGDPSHIVDMPWDAGTSKKNGIFIRNNTAACDPYADIIKGWCDTGDIYCDSGNLTGVHGSYFSNYTFAATDFIVGKYNASLTSSSGNATSTSPAPTSSATSTVSPGAGVVVRPSVITASGAFFVALVYGALL